MTPCPKPPRRGPKSRQRIRRTVPVRKRSARRGEVERKDAAWRREIRDRVEGHCERTGARGEHAHHVWPKGAYPHLRHNLDNGVYLTNAEHDKAHRDMDAFREWYARTFPLTWARLERARKEKA